MEQGNKVSIILPAYKAGNIIAKAIKSVLSQTYKNIELIVIENGPMEMGTVQKMGTVLFSKFLNENGNRDDSLLQILKYFYTEEANVSNARNIGLSNATGKYVAFIDADDEYTSTFIEEMVKKIESTNAELVSCGYKTVNSKRQVLVKRTEKVTETTEMKEYLETLKEDYLFNEIWNKLYVLDILKNNNIMFNKKYELGEDLIFNLDYLRYVQKACYINKPLYIYRDTEEGLKLKYRPDKFQIEYELTKYLELFYKEKNYSMEYIYNRFARVYYNGIIDIYKKNNSANKKEKDKQLEEFIKTPNYKSDLNFLKNKITDKKFKIAVNCFFLRGKTVVKLFIWLSRVAN